MARRRRRLAARLRFLDDYSPRPGARQDERAKTKGRRPASRTPFSPARAQEYAFSMRRRFYFLRPDVKGARHTADALLLAPVGDRHMHFLARRGTDLGELHEASYLFKTDLLHGAGVGLMLGGIGGLILGAIIVAYPPEGTQPQLVAVLIAAIVGGILGAWMASMAAAAGPNSRVKAFPGAPEGGKGPL